MQAKHSPKSFWTALKSIAILKVKLTDEWKDYTKTFNPKETFADVTKFNSAFALHKNSKVYLDDVSLVKAK